MTNSTFNDKTPLFQRILEMTDSWEYILCTRVPGRVQGLAYDKPARLLNDLKFGIAIGKDLKPMVSL